MSEHNDPEEAGPSHEMIREWIGDPEAFEALKQAALSAPSAEQFVEDIFGDKAAISELAVETHQWTVDQHLARARELRAEADEVSDELPDDSDEITDEVDVEEMLEAYDLEFAAEFHEQAASLLRERSVGTLADVGQPETAAGLVGERMESISDEGPPPPTL